jgi:hypothetical protein
LLSLKARWENGVNITFDEKVAKNFLKPIKEMPGWVLVVHTCDPNYLEGRDQEDCGLRPVKANSS